jgi:hypothetical protein
MVAKPKLSHPPSPAFEEIWAILQRTSAIGEETKLQMQETDRRLKETERIVKRNGKQIGGLHRRFGELAEHLVAPGIAKRFNELGYFFDSVSPGGHKILDEKGNTKTQIDLLLENGDCIIALEVKVRPALLDIGHHVRRLEILREHRSKRRDDRKIRGAIAGAIFGEAEKRATLEAGLYVVEQSGDTMKIDIPSDFIPKEW